MGSKKNLIFQISKPINCDSTSTSTPPTERAHSHTPATNHWTPGPERKIMLRQQKRWSRRHRSFLEGAPLVELQMSTSWRSQLGGFGWVGTSAAVFSCQTFWQSFGGISFSRWKMDSIANHWSQIGFYAISFTRSMTIERHWRYIGWWWWKLWKSSVIEDYRMYLC